MSSRHRRPPAGPSRVIVPPTENVIGAMKAMTDMIAALEKRVDALEARLGPSVAFDGGVIGLIDSLEPLPRGAQVVSVGEAAERGWFGPAIEREHRARMAATPTDSEGPE